jgi:hypothetical protein
MCLRNTASNKALSASKQLLLGADIGNKRAGSGKKCAPHIPDVLPTVQRKNKRVVICVHVTGSRTLHSSRCSPNQIP